MKAAREQYLKRIQGTWQLRMRFLHHHVMDRILAEFKQASSLDDLLRLLNVDEHLLLNDCVSGNLKQLKLTAWLTLQSLIGADLLSESETGRYVLHWQNIS